MLQATSGIVLHTIKYSETSLIAKVFTRDSGLQSCMVSGVRSKKSKNKATAFQPLSLVDLVISNNGKGGLQRITEINVQHPYSTIPYDIIKSTIALFLNEVIYRSVKEDHPDPPLFEFLKSSLLILDLKSDSCANFHLYFMIRMSRYLGFYPQGSYQPGFFFDLREGMFRDSSPSHPFHLEPALALIFNELLNESYEGIHRVSMDKMQRRQLLQGLVDFYRLHISGFGEMRSKEVLEEVIG